MPPSHSLTIDQAISRAKKAVKQGNIAVALKLYNEVLQHSPNHPVAKKGLRKLQKKRPHDQSVQALASNPPQDQINALVRNLELSVQIPETVQVCRELLKAYPQSLVVINILGAALHKQGKLQEAVQAYDKLIQLKPDLAEPYNNRAIVLQALGQFEQAMASYGVAIQLNPDFSYAYFCRGNALKELGQIREAAENYGKAVMLKPDYAPAHNNHGGALQELGRLEEALESNDKAIQLEPNNVDALYNRHALLLDSDDLLPAIKCMEKAIDINPSNNYHRFILGMLWDYSGDTQKAASHFDRVEKGDSLNRAKLDAWHYIKSVNNKDLAIIGSGIQVFKACIDAAIVDGLVLEFGVRFGTSIRQIAALVDQDVHGFDSFQGLPESWHAEAEGSYSTKGTIPAVPKNVTLHDGWFEETLPKFVEEHPEPVRFMNIDCDLYSSTKTVLDLLAKQIIPGTVIVFDEYIGNEHWREDEFKAFQEATVKYGWEYEYLYFSFSTKQVVARIT